MVLALPYSPFISKLLIVCGVSTFLVALTFSVEQSQYNERGTSAQATILQITQRLKSDRVNYHFLAADKEIQGSDLLSNGLPFAPKYQVGDTIEIEYLRNKPQANRIKKNDPQIWIYIGSLIMLFVGMRMGRSSKMVGGT